MIVEGRCCRAFWQRALACSWRAHPAPAGDCAPAGRAAWRAGKQCFAARLRRRCTGSRPRGSPCERRRRGSGGSGGCGGSSPAAPRKSEQMQIFLYVFVCAQRCSALQACAPAPACNGAWAMQAWAALGEGGGGHSGFSVGRRSEGGQSSFEGQNRDASAIRGGSLNQGQEGRVLAPMGHQRKTAGWPAAVPLARGSHAGGVRPAA